MLNSTPFSRPLVLSLCLLFASLAFSCGPNPEQLWLEDPAGAAALGEAERPIINGKDCGATEQVSSVAIIVDATFDILGFKMPIRTVGCTGTLVAPDVVLTAAHCVTPSMLSGGLAVVLNPKYYISFTADLSAVSSSMGGPLPDLPQDAVEAGSWIANPGFNPGLLVGFKGGLTNLYDVGLIFLKKELKAPQPAVLVTKEEAKQVKVGSEVLISGWGQQTAGASNPLVPPPKGTVGKKICAVAKINEVGPHEMQVGSDENSSRKCHGDSGGPSYMTVQSSAFRKERVVGITSHAYDASDCKKGGIDTRVDAWLDWIGGEMKKACKDGKRPWCKVTGIIPPGYYDPKSDQGLPDLGMDSSPATDGSQDDPGEDGGCDCRVAAAPSRGAGTVACVAVTLSLWGILLLRRRHG